MVALAANQHELLADGALGGLVFGTQSTSYLTLSHPSKEPGDIGATDSARSREDGVRFGEDYAGAASVAFEVGVLTDGQADPHGANADALDRFESEWQHPKWRNRLDAYAVLRSNMKGRTRRAYGRPRRFAATEDGLAKKGYSTFVCDFTVGDGRWYDDTASTVITPPSGGAGGTRQVLIPVGGTQDAWPVVTLSSGSSPLIDPFLVIGPLAINLPGYTLGAGQTLTIDPRPWSRQFIKNGNRNTPVGDINPFGNSTLLRDYHLPPGTYMVALSGNGVAANASASAEWRNAWSRW